jgi:hypothetical protein
MTQNQIYDGYKPIVCEMHPTSNCMALMRNGEYLGLVKVNNVLGGPVKMFDPVDVIINFQVDNHFYLNMNDLMIIQECWNQMQETRMSETKTIDTV